MTDNPRILVVGPSWVGDMVMAQSLFKQLKRRHPDAAIDVLAPAWSRPLLERMPEVNTSLIMPWGHGKLGLSGRRDLGRSLRGRHYHQAILLPNSWKSALTPYWARIPVRTGWVGELRYGLLNDIRRLDKSRLTMTVQRFVALAGDKSDTAVPEIPPPQLKVRTSDVTQALNDLALEHSPQRPLLALCPGAEFGPAKRWPASAFGQLARDRTAVGWDVWLFGSDKDAQVCAEVNAASGGACTNLAGRTSLAQAVDLMSLAAAVVANDSGLMHVAAALGRPLVALYGSSDPNFTPPLNQQHVIVSLALDCSPCFARECPLGHMNCLNSISSTQVDQALDRLLAPGSA